MALSKVSITQFIAGIFPGIQRTALFNILSRVATDTVNVASSTYAVPAGVNDMLITLNLAAGITATLPPATGTGRVLKFFVSTAFTGNGIVRVTTTDIIQGTLGVSTDAGGVVIPTAAASDTITMSGSTTGGQKGSLIVLQDIASGLWGVSGGLVSTGAEATPFSAAVS